MEAFVKRIILLIEILLAACLFTGSVPYGNAKEEIAVNTPEFNWENYNIITHALGGLDGYTYLNSRESFINHYDKGCRFFEVDLSQTSDGVWVCRHNWKEPMGQWEGDKKKVLSAEEFLNTPIYGKYTPMSFEDLLKLLDEYPDAFVTIDSKQYSVRNYQRTLEDYAQYREIAINAGLEHTLGQIIPELYNSAMYSGTMLVYKFPAYLYSLWQEYSIEELNDIADFCQANQIQAVSLYCEYWSEDVQKIFDERDILVYIYTINDEEKAREYVKAGAKGVCTDTLISENLE
jgi:glycerophosphoryl diester phosphodiesterase